MMVMMRVRGVCRRVLGVLEVALLVGGSAMTPGCIIAAAGAGAWYAFGEDTMYSRYDVKTTEAAVRDAFEDGGVTYTGTKQRDDGMMVTGTMMIGDDREQVRVGVWDKGPEKDTKIEIRIGTVSQETAQQELMGHIQNRIDAVKG